MDTPGPRLVNADAQRPHVAFCDLRHSHRLPCQHNSAVLPRNGDVRGKTRDSRVHDSQVRGAGSEKARMQRGCDCAVVAFQNSARCGQASKGGLDAVDAAVRVGDRDAAGEVRSDGHGAHGRSVCGSVACGQVAGDAGELVAGLPLGHGEDAHAQARLLLRRLAQQEHACGEEDGTASASHAGGGAGGRVEVHVVGYGRACNWALTTNGTPLREESWASTA